MIFRFFFWACAILIGMATLSGCATVPENPWETVNIDSQPATMPVDCGRFPLPMEITDDTMVYDRAGANQLEAYRVCSEANEAIAAETALALDQQKIAAQGLVQAGKAEYQHGLIQARILAEERRHWLWERVGYWILLGAAFAAGR